MYAKSFVISITTLFFIVAFIEGVEIMRRIVELDGKILCFLYVVLLKSTITISSFFPFIAFLAAIMCIVVLNNRLELIVMRCLGISVYQIAFILSTCAIFLGILYLTIFNYTTTYAVREIKILEPKITTTQQNVDHYAVTKTGLWFKDTNNENDFIIHSRSLNEKKQTLHNANFFVFDKNMSFLYSIYSVDVKIENDYWIIKNAILITTDNRAKHIKSLYIPTSLSIAKINNMMLNPKSIYLWQISKYISILDKIGLSTTRYKIQLFSQIASVIQILAFIILATVLCVVKQPRCTNKYYMKVGIAIILAFPIHFVNSMLIAYGINESLSAFTSTIIFPSSILLYLLYFMRKQK